MKRHCLVIIPAALLLLLLIGCPSPMTTIDGAGDPAGARRITLKEGNPSTGIHEKGVLGPGSKYEIWVPPAVAWNHCLVIYAHGYVNPLEPVELTADIAGMLGTLQGMGFAVAHTSYSENGWAVKDGAIRVRQLRDYFAGAYGTPLKVYLVGASEGAMISIMLAEKNPELFSGALCIGGPLGGAEMEVKYIYNVRILFDYFFGDELSAIVALAGVPEPLVPDQLKPLLPWVPLAKALQDALGNGALDARPSASLFPDGADFATNVVPLLLVLFGMDPVDAARMAATMVDGQPVFGFQIDVGSDRSLTMELAGTIAGGLWYNIFGTEDMLSRTHGHVPVDNTGSIYTCLIDPTAFVEGDVERLVSRPDARNYLDHWYQTTGKLKVPVVILHTEQDPIVPAAHAYKYQALAIASGSGGKLWVDVIPDVFGHCQILVAPTYTEEDVLGFGAKLVVNFIKLIGM
jgi:pimeloyl-ACP methyl ester carboxylesterase